MTSGAALLFATLIGVFITPDGIVVGADTALSTLTGQVAVQQKYCVTGPRSIATLQGTYLLREASGKETIELNDRFRALCSQIERATTSPPLREQAQLIANSLRTDLAAFLGRVPAADVIRSYSPDPVVARIVVTGYQNGRAESVAVGVGIATEGATSRWQAQVRDLSRLTFAGCGVRFHGQEVVVAALRTDTDARIPRAERQKEDVAKLTSLVRGECSTASVASASSLFVQAMRLTVTLGDGFGIPKGAVSMPIDVVVIPRGGSIQVTRIDSW